MPGIANTTASQGDMSLANRGNMPGKAHTTASQGDMSMANRGNMRGKARTSKSGRYESGKQRQHAR